MSGKTSFGTIFAVELMDGRLKKKKEIYILKKIPPPHGWVWWLRCLNSRASLPSGAYTLRP